LIEVGLLHDRWHAVGDWPPSPFRLFQALVAGAYGGRWAAEDCASKDAAFRWLEGLPPPRIAAPPRRPLRPVTSFVPNNDLDAVGGDPARIAEIRTAKTSTAVMLERGTCFLYAWEIENDETLACHICTLADRLHTFGRGVDAAFARGEVVDAPEAGARFVAHGGILSRPTASSSGGCSAPCPTDGSLDSLKVRHRATVQRFQSERDGRKVLTLFRQSPKAHARRVSYDSPPTRLLYELRRPDDLRRFRPVPQEHTMALCGAIRDAVKARLVRALPDSAASIDRFLVGTGAQAADVGRRVRIVPLPSIGGPNTSPSIRRVAVEVPPDCPVPARDLDWSFSGLDYVDGATGEVLAALLRVSDKSMTRHYGFDAPSRLWRSVTPVALPNPPGRARTGGERANAESSVAASLAAAVRHAGIEARVVDVRIQREPFQGRGVLADAFGAGRFAGRLRHVEVAFERPIWGPLVIGDGRFVGLGLMRPLQVPSPALRLFAVDPSGTPALEHAVDVARALRRAVMARAQAVVGARAPLPPFFSGHEADGRPLRSGKHEHLYFLAEDANGDGRIDRLAVIAPHLVDRGVHPSRERLDELDRALDGFEVLRAGQAGVLHLSPLWEPDEDDRVFGRGRVWISRTPYRSTRHPHRKDDAEAAVREDILAECARRSLARPEVEVLGARGGGAAIQTRLRFSAAVQGPILLGVGSHLGAGLFAAEAA
jgi:CRISPR-associated protein Csb2